MAWNRVCEACEDYFVGAAVHEVESVEDEPPGETSFYQRSAVGVVASEVCILVGGA